MAVLVAVLELEEVLANNRIEGSVKWGWGESETGTVYSRSCGVVG